MYGYQLWKQVKERDKIDVEIPTIYQHLSELIRLGYVKRTESKTILGRRREYYSLTEKGEAIA
jgi:DNA-binding PadR family transcriptional regulator